MLNVTDTIFALCTPPGKSGVAMVRVSGPQAFTTLAMLGVDPLPVPRMAALAKLESGAEVLDEALVLRFVAPHSFSGEDCVEYHTHGSRAVVKRLLEALSAMPNLRPAEPGEFTRRAFNNGKMDLTAAEGLADLIDAETEAQRRQAVRFMQGEAARFYGVLRMQMLEALALTEAYIDFPDEEIPESVLAQTDKTMALVAQQIEGQLADKGASERIRDGIQVAILGPTNAGKSSLMNMLANRDVAIVSDIAGTTRDVIEVHLDIGGYAVIVADTAGLRESQDAVEAEGMRRSVARAKEADIRILVLDAVTFAEQIEDKAIGELIDFNAILLINKTDLIEGKSLPSVKGLTPLPFSALRQTGMDEFMAQLETRIAALSATPASYIACSRHRHYLTQALAHIMRYRELAGAGLELRCEELRRASVEIGKITGVIGADEVLGVVFSRFCIGK